MRARDVSDAVVALLTFGFLCFFVGLFVNSHYKLVPKDSPLLFGIGIAVVVLVGGALVFAFYAWNRFREWDRSWSTCEHGVAGGRTRNLCEKCVEDQRLTEENRRRNLEAEERAKRLERDATQLQQDERRRLSASLVLTLKELRGLTPQKFEDEMARMFGRLGFAVEQTPYVNDFGRDAILTKNAQKFLLECKKYGDGVRVGRPELQKFHSAIVSDSAVRGFFVTTGTFTKEARAFADTIEMDLFDGPQLIRLLFQSQGEPAGDDRYQSKCTACGDIVQHRLRMPAISLCRNGHEVAPTLDIEAILSESGGAPKCVKCGTPMRLIKGKRGKFWGCSRYPTCKSTRRWPASPGSL
jgi:Restriction endonuclease/Topoisomerase DNA binding C4 zinc finger